MPYGLPLFFVLKKFQKKLKKVLTIKMHKCILISEVEESTTTKEDKEMAKRRMRFMTWARKDPDDETKIVYTFRTKEWDGTTKTMYFTSEDTVAYSMIRRIRAAWIEKIERVQNEFEDCWNIVLYED